MLTEEGKGGEGERRAEIYALGVMAFEALTGRTAFNGDNYPAIAHSHIYEEPPDPRIFNPLIPLQIRDVILIALQKKPEYRYQYANEIAEALESAVQSPDRGSINPGTAHRPASIVRAPASPLYLFPNRQRPNTPDTYFCTRCHSWLTPCPNFVNT